MVPDSVRPVTSSKRNRFRQKKQYRLRTDYHPIKFLKLRFPRLSNISCDMILTRPVRGVAIKYPFLFCVVSDSVALKRGNCFKISVIEIYVFLFLGISVDSGHDTTYIVPSYQGIPIQASKISKPNILSFLNYIFKF
jgi:hypothetical protein